jgi:hypothetical protein
MKAATLLICIGCCSLFVHLSCAESGTPRVDAHGDGMVYVSLTFVVIDGKTHAPIPNAEVTFFNAEETALLKLIEAEERSGGPSAHIAPKGTVATTNADGRLTMKCKFNASFLWSFDGGQKRDVGTQVFPSGRFVVSKGTYFPEGYEARTLFPEAPYSLEQLPKAVTLQLTESPIRPSDAEHSNRRNAISAAEVDSWISFFGAKYKQEPSAIPKTELTFEDICSYYPYSGVHEIYPAADEQLYTMRVQVTREQKTYLYVFNFAVRNFPSTAPKNISQFFAGSRITKYEVWRTDVASNDWTIEQIIKNGRTDNFSIKWK